MPRTVGDTGDKRDYYDVLGIPADADDKAIKDAFRTLALKYHPDRNREPGAEEKFKEIAAAYAVLSDPEKRKAYDAQGFAGVSGFSEEDLFRDIDFGDLFAGMGFDLGGFVGGGLFERLFGGRRHVGPSRGRNLEIALEIPLSRVAHGGEEKIRYMRTKHCPACHRTGARDGTKHHPCAACQGTGQKTQDSRRKQRTGEVLVRSIGVCPECNGSGRIIDEQCPQCLGQGLVEEEEALTVNVPIGAEEGMVLRIPGHGMPSGEKGGAPGDLFVILRSEVDPRFQREEADLWRREEITIAEAVLGTQKNVPSLDGSVEMHVPAGTQPGMVLRLTGKGLPRFGGGRHGDLYVRIDVRVPERLSEREKALYVQLRELENHEPRARGRASKLTEE